jgi:hypothetical protein
MDEHVLKVVLKRKELIFFFEAVHPRHSVVRLDLELEGICISASPHDQTLGGALERPDLLITHCRVYRHEQRRATLNRSGVRPELHSVAKIKIVRSLRARIK